MKKQLFIVTYILADLIIGACIGFLILHPLSMLIQKNYEYHLYPVNHFLFTKMSLYFTLIGIGLGGVSGYFRIVLKHQNDKLKKQQRIIQEQNKNFKASINYAKHIQDAIFARVQEIKQYLPECFILHKPKDIVSGDLYWFKKSYDKFFIAAIDCTGHGVPGALLSMVANDLLNEIISEFKIYSPDLILNKLHSLLRQTLNQDKSGNWDGMDIVLCCIDKTAGVVEYAGAKNPLVYIQNRRIQIIKADRFSIGGYSGISHPIFTKHTLPLQEPIMFYLFTDGYQDQFGSNQKGKLKPYRFRELLLHIHDLPPIRQKLELDRTFETWKNIEPQTDDVLVIGVKI